MLDRRRIQGGTTTEVQCQNCGGPLGDPLVAECPRCGVALVEARRSETRTGHGVRTVATTETARRSSGDGVESLSRRCTTCGATTRSPDATTCPYCQAALPSFDETIARAASRAPTSPQARARLRDSLANLDVSPGLRDAMLRAEAQLGAGCPSCGGGLTVREHKVTRTEKRAFVRLGRRRPDVGAKAAPGPVVVSYQLNCSACGFSQSLDPA